MIIAVVNDFVVTAIATINDPSVDGGVAYQAYAQSCQIAIDITNTVPQPQVGWTFNGSALVSNGTNTTQITKLAFRERFTPTELVGIIAASQAQTTEGYTLQMMMQNQSIATYIDLARSDTIAGIDILVSYGLLTSARANTILTTPPSSTEVYTG
jgi:hypothetical protein